MERAKIVIIFCQWNYALKPNYQYNKITQKKTHTNSSILETKPEIEQKQKTMKR